MKIRRDGVEWGSVERCGVGISNVGLVVFFFKQKTAYEIKECDWSSDVCSSDLPRSATTDPSAPE